MRQQNISRSNVLSTALSLSMIFSIVITMMTVGGCEQQPAAESTSSTKVEPTATPATPAATKTPAPTSTPAAPAKLTGIPEITFEKTTVDFGDISDTERHRTSFAFTNTGSARLVIKEVKAACGCTVPTLRKKEFEPGEGDVIEIVFNPKGKQGKTDKNITVISNAPNSPLTLSLASNIKPLIEYTRMHKVGDIPLNTGYEEIIPLTYTDPDLEFLEVSVNSDYVHGELLQKGEIESTDGGTTTYRADLRLTVDQDAPWGLIYATRMNMKVLGRPRPDADPVEYAYDMYVSGNVFGDIKASPSIIGLSRLDVDQDFERSATLTSTTGTPFEIVDATVSESSMEGVEVRVEPTGASSYRLVVYGNTGAFKGSIRGIASLTTSIVGEEKLDIRFSGFVK